MRDWILPVAFSAVIVLIQAVFAPVLSVFGVVPSFIVAFVLVLCIMRRADTTYVYAFVLGLIADLFTQTPLGLTPLLLLAVTFVLSRSFEVLDDTTPTMPLISFAVALFAFELVFAIVLLISGYQGSFFEILVQRVLVSTVLNWIICAVLYFIMRRFPFMQASNDAWRVADNVRFR